MLTDWQLSFPRLSLFLRKSTPECSVIGAAPVPWDKRAECLWHSFWWAFSIKLLWRCHSSLVSEAILFIFRLRLALFIEVGSSGPITSQMQINQTGAVKMDSLLIFIPFYRKRCVCNENIAKRLVWRERHRWRRPNAMWTLTAWGHEESTPKLVLLLGVVEILLSELTSGLENCMYLIPGHPNIS